MNIGFYIGDVAILEKKLKKVEFLTIPSTEIYST